MKIGILTFHFAKNSGAVLQTYALQKTLQKLGHEVYVIDYVPENKIAEHVYTKIGFRPTGEESNGEIVLRMDL